MSPATPVPEPPPPAPDEPPEPSGPPGSPPPVPGPGPGPEEPEATFVAAAEVSPPGADVAAAEAGRPAAEIAAAEAGPPEAAIAAAAGGPGPSAAEVHGTAGCPGPRGGPDVPELPPELPPEFVPPGPGIEPPTRPDREPDPVRTPLPGLPWWPSPQDDMRTHVYDHLLARRTIVVDRTLDGPNATYVAAQLMTLDADGDEPITLLVNCPGGPLDAAATVLDTMALVQGPVDTTCLGQATGTAAIIVASGTGRRRAGAGARFSLRMPGVELRGPASRLGEEVAHLGRLHALVVDRLVEATGQERRLVARDVDRGRTLSAPEAVTYGLVDEIVSRSRP